MAFNRPAMADPTPSHPQHERPLWPTVLDLLR